MSDGTIIETVDLDVLAAIRLFVPGEHCPHCQSSGKLVSYSKSHGDQVTACPFCYGGLVAFPICECGDWQHQHEGMTGKCLICQHDKVKLSAFGFGPCAKFRFAWNEKPSPRVGAVVAAAFWEMWNEHGVAAAEGEPYGNV